MDVYPIGIDPKELLDMVDTVEVQNRIMELKKSFSGKKIIIARDRMEKSNGMILFVLYKLAQNSLSRRYCAET